MKAIWKDQIIADSSDTVIVEGNHYFPMSSIRKEFYSDSKTETICSWKGTAKYFSVNVNGETNKDAAWFYESPTEAAAEVKGRVAFWKGVQIVS